jgi:hypothetical protein
MLGREYIFSRVIAVIPPSWIIHIRGQCFSRCSPPPPRDVGVPIPLSLNCNVHRSDKALQQRTVPVAILAFVDPLRVCGSEKLNRAVFAMCFARCGNCCVAVGFSVAGSNLLKVAENLSLPLVRFSSLPLLLACARDSSIKSRIRFQVIFIHSACKRLRYVSVAPPPLGLLFTPYILNMHAVF